MKPQVGYKEKLPYIRYIKLICFLSSFSIITYLFLIMPNLTHSDRLSPLTNCLFAHRGLFDNTCYIPENSLSSFQKAIDYGYGIELDVQLTKDNIPVVFHDYTLERVCGENRSVSQLIYEELSSYYLFNSSEHIPTLTEALQLINGQVPLMIEIKANVNYKEICRQIANVLKSYRGYYCIISFNPFVLEWFKQAMPSVIRGQLSTDFFKDRISGTPTVKFMLTHLLLNCISRPDFISYNCKYISNPSLNICRSLFDIPIVLWTVRSEDQYAEISEHYNVIVFDSFIPELETEPEF